jgi:hypothetical protein
MALFYLGAQIIQPRVGGESVLGRIGESGVNMLNWLNASREKSAAEAARGETHELERQKVGIEGQRAGASIENLKAQTREMELKMETMPQEARDKHLQSLAEYHNLLARGDLEGAQKALTAAKAQLEGDPKYQKAVIDEMNARIFHYKEQVTALHQPAMIKEVEAYASNLQAMPSWHPEITDPKMRKITAQDEAWKRFYPGGAKEIAAGLDADQLVEGSEAAFAEAQTAGKVPKNVSPAQWKSDWINQQVLMGSSPAKDKALAKVQGAATGAAGGAGARPAGVPSNANQMYLQADLVHGIEAGNYWVWTDPQNPSNTRIKKAQ